MAVALNTPLPPGVKDEKEYLKAFIFYLAQQKLISADDLRNTLKFQATIDTRLGQLATLKGYLTPRDVVYVVASQTDLHLPFGQIALQKNFMTTHQLQEILKIQGSPLTLFLESVILTKGLPEELLQGHLDEFSKKFHTLLKTESDPLKSTGDTQAIPLPISETRKSKPSQDKIRATLQKVKGLATLPTVIDRVLSLLADPNVDIDKIAVAIQGDPSLSTQILRIVNSAFFGMRGKVSGVQRAIVVLGVRGVRQVVLSALVLDKFKSDRTGDMKLIWKHSVLTAQWARALAKERGIRDAEDIFVAGLLHNVGELALLQTFGEATLEIKKLRENGTPQLQAEFETLGISHPEIGNYLCNLWGFPESISQAMSLHHAPAAALAGMKNITPSAAIVNASARLADLPVNGAATPEGNPLPDFSSLEPEFFEYHRIDAAALLSRAPAVLKAADDLERILL